MARVQSVKLYRFTCGLETVQNFYLCVKRHVMPCHVDWRRLHHLTFVRSKSLGSISGIHRSHTWKHATPLNLQTRPEKRMNLLFVSFLLGGIPAAWWFLAIILGSHEVLPGEPARLLANTTVSELPAKAPNCVRLAMRQQKIGGAEMMFFFDAF